MPKIVTIPQFSEEELVASICKQSFYEFLQIFWDTVIPEDPVWNWHIEYLCDELQRVAERVFANKPKLYDLIINVPPGTTKSTVCSVMFPVWTWIRSASTRCICASYAYALAVDLSRKSRDVVKSDKFKKYFPKFKLREDQDCLAKGTEILLANGSPIKIERLKVGDLVLSVDGFKVVKDRVVSLTDAGVQEVYKIQLSDGTTLRATGNHRLFSWDSYVYVRDLKVGDPLCVVGKLPSQEEKLITKDDAFLLALWLAEGTKSHSAFMITNWDTEIESRLVGIAAKRGWKVHGKGKNLFLTCGSKRQGDTPNNLLRKYGLRGMRTETIRIPKCVLSSPDSLVREFLGTYLACDGYVSLKSGSGCVGIATASPRMASDLRLLFKRIGVQSFVSVTPSGYKKDGLFIQCRDSHKVMIRRKKSILLLNKLPLYEKVSRLEELIQKKGEVRENDQYIPPNWREGITGIKSSDIGTQGWATKDFVLSRAPYLASKIEGDMEWRKVVSISLEKKVQTYDIETEKHHAFLAEGVWSHNSKGYFINERGGSRFSVGVNGSVTGMHGHFIIVDDPLDPGQALSEADVRTANHWLFETLASRKIDKRITPIILIMQRLHQEDPTGAMLDKSDDSPVKHICLPAELMDLEEEFDIGVSPPHLASRYTDNLLDPVRLPKHVLVREQAQMGEFGYAGQFLQNPAPRGGGMFHVDQLKYGTPPQHFKNIIRYWDKAASKTGRSAYSVGCKIARDLQDNIWILDVKRGRWDASEREAIIQRTAEQDTKSIQVGLEQEGGSGGKESAEATARRLHGWKVIINKVNASDGDKIQRADPLASQVNAGNVYLVQAPWNDPFIDELRHFPVSKYKDQVDAAAGGYNIIGKDCIEVGGLW